MRRGAQASLQGRLAAGMQGAGRGAQLAKGEQAGQVKPGGCDRRASLVAAGGCMGSGAHAPCRCWV